MAKRLKTSIAIYKINKEKLSDFISKSMDLTKILSKEEDNKIIMKIDMKNVLIYSSVGQGNDIHSFKSYSYKTDDFFSNKKELENGLVMIIGSAKKFARNIKIFLDFEEDDIDFKLTYNEDNYVEKLLIRNSKLNLDIPGSDPKALKFDMDIEVIKDAMNPDNSLYNFKLSKEDFNRIKKMGLVEIDNDILYLTINEGKISIGETKWQLALSSIEEEDSTISFPKKYFNSINFTSETEMYVYVFDSFLMILGDNTNLLVSTEFTI